jgi:hypothetical protein
MNCTHKIAAAILAALILQPCPGKTQDIKTEKDTAASTSWIPSRSRASITCSREAKSDFKSTDSRTESASMSELQLSATAPLYLGPEGRLFSGLRLQWNHFDFTGSEWRDVDTYIIAVPFRAMYDLAEKWTLMGTLGMYTLSPKIRLSIGMAYARIFGRDKAFPVAGASWSPTPQWQVSLMYPRPGITYAPTRKLRLFTYVTPAGSEWNIEHRVDGEDQQCEFRFKGYRAGLGAEYDLTSFLSLEISGGGVFNRNYDLKDKHADSIIDEDLQDTWFAQIGLRVR